MDKSAGVTRIFVEKQAAFAHEAQALMHDLQINLGQKGLSGVRILIRYDYEHLPEAIEESALPTIFSEPPVDRLFCDTFPRQPDDFVLTVELLPGQYDQRADSAAQCVQLLSGGGRIQVRTAKTYVFSGTLSVEDRQAITRYLINPVDSRQASEALPTSLDQCVPQPASVARVDRFIEMSLDELERLIEDLGLAMNREDMVFCQRHFRDDERRNPSLTELKMLDTYWSDHCRHTTFMAAIDRVDIDKGPYSAPIESAWQRFKVRALPFFDPEAELTLMRLATFSMKRAKSLGLLEDLEESGENNACSIVRTVDVGGQVEPWLVMFKNETHNHPTEIEPYGGAATCLGGAIRDPLSGRSYVYQAMRVTGAADPTQAVENTLPGKLPQFKITREAAAGYSGYGNQIGLATGLVHEFYHPGYVAKRMEVGAVIAAAPQKQVRREEPVPGDRILLIGGRTGRDGIGGATGSSKTHTEQSIETAGSEVQKGNPPEERKLQRLFRNPQFTRLVKKSNDFGAGGVSVAIGELAPGLEINLDRVPKKYDGLDGTELALSESQERMAVVVSAGDVAAVIELADTENLETSEIAVVTKEARLRMLWRNETIVDLGRDFIDSSGVQQQATVRVSAPDAAMPYFSKPFPHGADLRGLWLDNLADLNVCSQQGLNERFDNSVGAATVLMPYGGAQQVTPVEAMVAKLPVLGGETSTASVMSFGFDPDLSQWSPFHGGAYAVIEALGKVVATGGDCHTVRFSLQEYFEKPKQDPRRWGKPFAALLGANHVLNELGLAAIGGKDSMSGSFNELDVPPTLIAFAVTTLDHRQVVSPEFKAAGRRIYLLKTPIAADGMPDLSRFVGHCEAIRRALEKGWIASARSVHRGGIAAALTQMALGNLIGCVLSDALKPEFLFQSLPGSFLVEWQGPAAAGDFFDPDFLIEVATTHEHPTIVSRLKPSGSGFELGLDEALGVWKSRLQEVFAHGADFDQAAPQLPTFTERRIRKPAPPSARPRVVIPTFPGSNCEYDCQASFNRAGAQAEIEVFRNQRAQAVSESIQRLAQAIDRSQILMIPGGFSAGDEPDGSGKFIAAVLRNPRVYDAILGLLSRDGLILGVCNGFQALIKTGLLPYGALRTPRDESPTLTLNTVGRYLSRMVHTRVVSTLSPWLWNREAGDVFQVAIAHAEGRFIAPQTVLEELAQNGQVATQYVAADGVPGRSYRDNPNGSQWAVEGVSSPDGRIFGKMGHNERFSCGTLQNIPGEKDDRLYAAGVDYFR